MGLYFVEDVFWDPGAGLPGILESGILDPGILSHRILTYLSYGFWTSLCTHLELGVLWDPGVWDLLESAILDPGILSHGTLSYGGIRILDLAVHSPGAGGPLGSWSLGSPGVWDPGPWDPEPRDPELYRCKRTLDVAVHSPILKENLQRTLQHTLFIGNNVCMDI